jgi:hypothetical protein
MVWRVARWISIAALVLGLLALPLIGFVSDWMPEAVVVLLLPIGVGGCIAVYGSATKPRAPWHPSSLKFLVVLEAVLIALAVVSFFLQYEFALPITGVAIVFGGVLIATLRSPA